MKEVRLGKHDVVVELSWELLNNPKNPAKSIASLIKTNPEYKGVKYGVITKAVGTATVGFVPAKQKTKLPSGAAWLATANRIKNQGKTKVEDWLIVESLGDGDYWLCAIKDGIPLPGVDLVGNFDVIGNKLEQILIVEGFTLYTTDSRIAEFVKARVTVYETSFEGLVEGVVLKDQIKNIGPSMVPVIVLVVLIVLGAVGGLWYKQQKDLKIQEEAREAQEQAEQQAKAAAEQKAKATAAYKAFASKVYDDLQKQVKASIDAPSNNAIIGSWLNVINNIGINNNGWALSSIDCDKISCTIKLKKGPWTTNELLKEIHPDVSFNDLNTDEASYKVSLGMNDPNRSYTDSDLADLNYVETSVVSEFQKAAFAKVKVEIQHPNPVIKYVAKFDPNVTEPKFADSNSLQGALKIDAGYSVGTFFMTGDQMWALAGSSDYLNYVFMGVEKMTMDLATYNWRIDGEYVIRGDKPDLDALVNDQINPPASATPAMPNITPLPHP